MKREDYAKLGVQTKALFVTLETDFSDLESFIDIGFCIVYSF